MRHGIPALTWLVGALCVHLGLSWAFSATVVADHNLTASDAAFNALPDRIPVLAVGDSHGRNAVDPQALCDGCGNIALGGEHIIKTRGRLNRLLDDSGKRVDVVLLPAEDGAFTRHLRDQYHPVTMWGKRVDFLDLATEVERPLDMGVLWFRARFIPYTDELPIWVAWAKGSRAHFREREMRGRMDGLPVRRRLADAVERYDKIFGDEPVVDPVKVAHFEALIDELTARGIRVVLVRYPLMPGFDRLVHKRGARQATEAVVDRIRAERDLPLLDYRDVFADQPELFADSDHVNDLGRRRFTVGLRNTLRARGWLE